MKNKILKLKNLRIIRECALNYDYVPDSDKANEIINDIIPSCILNNMTVDELVVLLNEYDGSSVSNIEDEIMRVIDTL